jgi:secreted trypsin-like serine protease
MKFKRVLQFVIIWMYLLSNVLSTSSIIQRRNLSSRIIGGKIANRKRYPYYTYLDIEFQSGLYSSCGGSLIARDMILTAAHCLGSVDDPIVQIYAIVNYTRSIGVTGSFTKYEFIREISKLIIHPKFDGVKASNDLALLLLKKPVNGVPLIKLNNVLRLPSVGQNLTVIGHGDVNNQGAVPDYLMEVSIKAISQKDCNDKNSYNGVIVQSTMICAGGRGRDSCFGDSGGPLFIRGRSNDNDVQVGIVSFGNPKACATANLPGVYTRVSYYRGWIYTVVCKTSHYKPRYCVRPSRPPS